MAIRIGYFVPEFPGQTHAFFWREKRVLEELGVQPGWLSTRQPPKKIISHSWAEQAVQETTYLTPFKASDVFIALGEVLKAGPVRWGHCLQSIAAADDLSFKEKLKLLAVMGMAGKLIHICRTQDWHHIHVHSCANSANLAIFTYLLGDISYSLTLHGPALETYGKNQKQKWKYAKFGLVVSDKLLQDIQGKLDGFLPKVLVSVPMGVSLSEIYRHQPYTPWDEQQVCRIFSCGRLNPVKGHNYLLKTVEMLQQRGVKVHLKIAGEDEQGGTGYHQTLTHLIQSMKLEDSVELLGAVSQDRIRQELENAHIFALASHNEGIPVAVMEAMAMEVPVVVTDVGGNAELIQSGVDGALVPDQDPTAMADAIDNILKQPDLAQRLSHASRQKIATKFHDRRSAEIITECLENVPL